MQCPYFKGKSLCVAHEDGVYVPSKEIEMQFCMGGNYRNCEEYKNFTLESLSQEAGYSPGSYRIKRRMRVDRSEAAPRPRKPKVNRKKLSEDRWALEDREA
jgi:hypothetical protein